MADIKELKCDTCGGDLFSKRIPILVGMHDTVYAFCSIACLKKFLRMKTD